MADELSNLLSKFGGAYTPAAAEGFQGWLTGKGSEPGQMASFEDMFKKFLELGQKETERQAAGLTETFGSRGARYGSDILQGQIDLRSQAAGNLAREGLGAITNVGNVALGFGQLETTQRENALNRLFEYYQMQTGLSPIAQALQSVLGVSPDTSWISY